jgi:hypothetical protein
MAPGDAQVGDIGSVQFAAHDAGQHAEPDDVARRAERRDVVRGQRLARLYPAREIVE